MIPAAGRRSAALDAAAAAALASLTIVYLWLWPRDLFGFDEGLYLYESRRLLDGDVFYRDVFEIITPGSFYLMAALFAVFGADMATARVAMAFVHAAIVVLLYLSCRTVGVRRELAILPGIYHLTVCFPANAIASPHWIATLSQAALLFAFLRAPSWDRPRWLALVGVLAGALILIQQPKGAVMAAGIAVLLMLDAIWDGAHLNSRLATVASRWAIYGASLLALAVPPLLLQVAVSGFAPAWDALVEFPLRHYPGFAQCRSWGYTGPLRRTSHVYFKPTVVRLPLVLPIGVLATIASLAGRAPADARRWAALAAIPALAIAAVYYCPNFTHLAIVVPLSLPLAAAIVERLCNLLPVPSRAARPVVALLAGALAIFLFGEMRSHLERQRERAPVAHATAFGRVDLKFSEEAEIVDAVRERVPAGDEIFVYPTYSSLYLMTGTRNPTRFQTFLRNYTPEEHLREVVLVMEKRRTPLVVVQGFFVDWREGRFMRYLAARYRRVAFGSPAPGERQAFALFERLP